MLHTVNKSPFERNALDSCLRHARPGAAILLFEDGVYAAVEDTSVAGRVADALGQYQLFVLGPDLAARGITPAEVIAGIGVVDYAGFVDLVVAHGPVQAWL